MPREKASTLAVALALIVLAVGCSGPRITSPLPALGAVTSRTSVSGLSSGAYMAGQFQLAYSRSVIGAGLVAGGPWACAQSTFAAVIPGPGQTFLNLSRALNGCMLNRLRTWGIPNAAELAERAKKLALKGSIDPIAAAANQRVYIFAGQSDSLVVPEMANDTAEFYRAIGVPSAQIKLVANVAAGHAFVTSDRGSPCETTAAPYVVDCDYDQAADLMAHVRGRVVPLADKYDGRVMLFDQTEFTRDLNTAGLSSEGALYIPKSCVDQKRCDVHIVFHGCDQNRAAAGDTIIYSTGLLRVADAHKVILLFPQADKSAVNPKGCWDWWGYTGENYLTAKGAQLQAVRRMLARLGEAPAAK